MSTFKNPFEERRDFPALGVSVGPGETFEVPDEVDASLEAQGYVSSKTKSPDVTTDPVAAEAVTAPVAPADPSN